MEIEEQIRRAQRHPTREHLEAMWRAIFTLKAWYFVPADPEEGENRPAVMTLDDATWLPACTDVRRYRAFAGPAGRVDDEGEVHGLLLSPADAVHEIGRVEAAIDGIVFNPQSEIAVRAPVEAVLEYAEHFDLPDFLD